MPTRLSWRTLFPGLIALAVIAVIAVGVLLFAGVGQVRGEKVRLYVVTNSARDVMRGSEVWLSGQQVGTVERVGFAPPGDDTTGQARVVLAIDVRRRDAGAIRRDSPVRVRSGANILGPIVVYLEPGTPASAAVRDGDTLRANAQSDAKATVVKLNAAMEQLTPLMADARTIVAHVRSTDGTIGAALRDRGGPELRRLRRTLAQLLGGAGNGNGRGEHGGVSVMALARGTLARADSIRQLLASDRTSLGRFRRDSTALREAVSDVVTEITELRTLLETADGNVARFANDSAITRALGETQRELALLLEDIRKRPLRYIQF